MSLYSERIVGRIVSFAKRKGLTQVELLASSGLNKNLLQDWKNGKGAITEDSLRKLAVVLDCTTEELRGEAPRLTLEQSQLVRFHMARITELQDEINEALAHPQFAARRWQELASLGEVRDGADQVTPMEPDE
jgi:transcriptional regulator with XRE-family HTH domain